jgi:bacterioferritin-associated ferredoxin
MIVCICNNINDKTISEDIINGMNVEQIIDKYECNNCEACHWMIEDMFNNKEQLDG